MQPKRVRRIILAIAIPVVILSMGAYLSLFLMVRSQAINDYEQVRRGKSPIHTSQLYPLEDGGSDMWEGSGYRVYRLKQYVGDIAESREQQEYLVGARLEFTCRGCFPILQRWMKDREESTIVVGP